MFSINKKRERISEQGSQIKQLEMSKQNISQIKKFNIAGNRWFICWNINGNYKVGVLDSRFVDGVLGGKFPHPAKVGFKTQNPLRFEAIVNQLPVFSLAVFSAEMEPLCAITHKDMPEKEFTVNFDHDRTLAALDKHTVSMKVAMVNSNKLANSIDKYSISGNRWFVYTKDDQKVIEVNSDHVKSLMSNEVLASYAVFSKDFKLIREFRNPDLADIDYDFMDLIGAFTAAAVGHEIMFGEGDINILENIF